MTNPAILTANGVTVLFQLDEIVYLPPTDALSVMVRESALSPWFEVLSSEYAVTGYGDPAGIDVTFTTAPGGSNQTNLDGGGDLVASHVKIQRRASFDRVADFSDTAQYTPQTFNAEFDHGYAAAEDGGLNDQGQTLIDEIDSDVLKRCITDNKWDGEDRVIRDLAQGSDGNDAARLADIFSQVAGFPNLSGNEGRHLIVDPTESAVVWSDSKAVTRGDGAPITDPVIADIFLNNDVALRGRATNPAFGTNLARMSSTDVATFGGPSYAAKLMGKTNVDIDVHPNDPGPVRLTNSGENDVVQQLFGAAVEASSYQEFTNEDGTTVRGVVGRRIGEGALPDGTYVSNNNGKHIGVGDDNNPYFWTGAAAQILATLNDVALAFAGPGSEDNLISSGAVVETADLTSIGIPAAKTSLVIGIARLKVDTANSANTGINFTGLTNATFSANAPSDFPLDHAGGVGRLNTIFRFALVAGHPTLSDSLEMRVRLQKIGGGSDPQVDVEQAFLFAIRVT